MGFRLSAYIYIYIYIVLICSFSAFVLFLEMKGERSDRYKHTLDTSQQNKHVDRHLIVIRFHLK